MIPQNGPLVVGWVTAGAAIAGGCVVRALRHPPENKALVNPGDFEARLRKLHGLKQDGLITEEGCALKRRQIIDEKW